MFAMATGERICRYRKNKGLTQAQLAKKANMSLMSIRRYESDVRQPKLTTLQKLADALDVSIGKLAGIEQDTACTQALLDLGMGRVYGYGKKANKRADGKPGATGGDGMGRVAAGALAGAAMAAPYPQRGSEGRDNGSQAKGGGREAGSTGFVSAHSDWLLSRIIYRA